MTTLFGIKNCDTIKKAKRWLDANGTDYTFHDFKSDGLSETLLNSWIKQVGWEALVNKRSSTWRNLSDADKTNINEQKAIQYMLAQPTLIKRPVLTHQEKILVGFKDSEYQQLDASME